MALMINKKNTLLLILLLVCSIPSFSQLEIGIRGGFLTTNRNFVPDIKSKSIGSINNYGLVFTVFGEKFLGMQTELAMTERGYKIRWVINISSRWWNCLFWVKSDSAINLFPYL